jgi:hypothetical protein
VADSHVREKVLNAWSVLLLKKAMCGTCSTSELPIQFGIKLDGVTEVLRDALRLRTMVVQVQAGI